jgi:hypothetical protein
MVSEVSCALGKGKTTYFVASRVVGSPEAIISLADRRKLQLTRLRRSADFGSMWYSAVPTHYADDTAMVVEPGQSSTSDRIFVFADGERRKMMFSNDGAKTIDHGLIDLPAVRFRAGNVKNTVMATASAARLEDGIVGALYLDPVGVCGRMHTGIMLTRVSPNGKVLGVPIPIAELSRTFSCSLLQGHEFNMQMLPSMAFGRVPGTNKQRIYVAWDDLSRGYYRIFLASSDDNGLTWTSPRIIDDLGKGHLALRDTSASHASIAVNSDGIVGVQWTEFDGRCWRFAASRDGGATFIASEKLNTCVAALPSYANNIADFIYGLSAFAFVQPSVKQLPAGSRSFLTILNFNDYDPLLRGTGLVADRDSSFFSSWVALGAGDGNALYVNHIHVRRTFVSKRRTMAEVRAPHAALRGRHAKALVAWMSYTHFHYDTTTHEFVIGTVLFVRGKSPQWPLIFRVRKLTSILGPLSVVQADNGVSKEGAEWVFSGPGGRLPQGSQAALDRALFTGNQVEVSNPKTVRLRLNGPPKEPAGERGQIYGASPVLTVEGDTLVSNSMH